MKEIILFSLIFSITLNLSNENKIKGETQKELNTFLIETDYTQEHIENLLQKAEKSNNISPNPINSQTHNELVEVNAQPQTVACISTPNSLVNTDPVQLESPDPRRRPIRRRDLLRVRRENDDGEEEDEDDDDRPYDEFLQANKTLIGLKQNRVEKALEIDEDSFGYGYALIVFFVVLAIVIAGYKALSNAKGKRGEALNNTHTDYILFDGKDQETEVATLL